MATLIYDSKITNKDEILKRIALVGYDSENSMRKRLYSALPGCCQYDRAADVKKEILFLKVRQHKHNKRKKK
jgi:hypothetical protein